MRIIKSASALAVLGLALAPAAAFAFGVDVNLGTLPTGNTPFSGTTIGADNDIDTYSNNTVAAKWDQDSIFQFTTTSMSTISLTSTDPDASPTGIDHDFFLLNSLTTIVNASGYKQATGLGNGNVYVSGTWGTFPAGTYYMVVDAYQGPPTNVSIPGPFSGSINIAPFVAPPPPPSIAAVVGGSTTSTLAAGQVGWYSFSLASPQAVSFDTLATTGMLDSSGNPDTELFLYDSNGLLLGTDDDDGPTGPQSFLSILNSGDELPALLPAGTYYLAITGYNAAGATTGFGVTSPSTLTGSYTITGLSVNVPEPTTLAALGLGGLLARRRRA